MVGRRNPFVAREGIPFLLASLFLIWAAWRYLPDAWIALPIALTVVLFLVFRDPVRSIPPSALGVVSPVDGKVVELEEKTLRIEYEWIQEITAAEKGPGRGEGVIDCEWSAHESMDCDYLGVGEDGHVGRAVGQQLIELLYRYLGHLLALLHRYTFFICA